MISRSTSSELSIRVEQLVALAGPDRDGFAEQVVQHLRAAFAEHAAPHTDDELRGLATTARVRGIDHGLECDADVARLAEYLLLYGETFGRTPTTAWAGEVLTNDALGGTEKMDEIDDIEASMLAREE